MGDGNTTQGDKRLNILLTNVKPEDGGEGPRSPQFDSDDFVEPVKIKLGQYLDRIITDSGMVYTPKQGEGFLDEMEPGLGSLAVQEFNNSSNTGLLPGININKTNVPSDPNTITRAKIFEDINLRGDEAQLPQTVYRVLEENSRFSANNPYINDETSATEENSGTKDFIPQQQFGKHTPQKWPYADTQNNIPIKIQDLKKLGSQVLLEASGEAISSRNSSKIGETPEALAMVTIVPGSARIGTKVAASRFSVGNIMSDINPTFNKPKISDLENDGPELMSYGSPYNPLVPFDSLNLTSSRVAASLLTLTVSSMITSLSAILKNSAAVTLDTVSKESGIDPRRKYMGSYSGYARSGLGSSETRFSTMSTTHFLMMYESKFDYTESVQKGLEIFFDLPSGQGIGTGQSAESFSTNENPGFYNVLLRSLVRDTSDIFVGSLGIGNLNSNNATSNLSSNPVTGTITNTENLIQNIRNSRLLRFMDILAKIGDIALMAQASAPDLNNPSGEIYTDDFYNDVVTDSEYKVRHGSDIKQNILVKRNRLSDKVFKPNALSMASNTITSMYRLSDEYIRTEKTTIGDADSSNILLGSNLYFKAANQTSRLSTEDVEKLEEILDSYYVPFYFHDLRTNEIIAFHAFLESVSDSFTADYSSTEGIGRIGKTHSYKNTNRSVSLSFRIVSTSMADFDEMWLKVNKLVTMLYPQYTKGRQVTNQANGYKFIQPFSQLIGASPMIRMRVGDLIKSNFSDIDLARLFGAGTSDFVINEDLQVQNQQNEDALRTKIQSITSLQTQGRFEANDKVILRAAYVTNPIRSSTDPRNVTLSLSPPARTSSTRSQRRNNGRGGRRRRGREPNASIVSISSGKKLKIISSVDSENSDQGDVYVYKCSLDTSTPVDGIETSDDLFLSVRRNDIGSTLELDRTTIVARARRELDIDTQPNAEITQSNLTNVKNFLDPQNGDNGNPIAQAFHSTKGQGLPGLIKSLKFDFADSTWETERENSRAPQHFKIDIDFEPINDINPGLGSDGFMIGAPYNIGSIMKIIKNNRKNNKISTT